MTERPTTQFMVEGWRVDPQLDMIEQDGRSVKLEPRLMKVLLTLAGRPGGLCTRDELLRTVWPEADAGDEVLTQAISSLRRHLGDSPRRSRIIQTVPKKGYRLIARIGDVGNPPVARVRRAGPAPAARPIVLALLFMVIAFTGVALMWKDSTLAPPKLELVTALRGRETDPAVSPDGARVAFIWSGGTAGAGDLYVKPLFDGEPRRLTRGAELELSPSWSPSGNRIAFARVGDDSCGIFVIDAETLEESMIASCRSGSYPQVAWSPRGDRLAISDSRGSAGPYVIVTMTPDGADRRDITDMVPGLGDRYPVFSPDGRRIAFVRTEGMGASDIHIVSSSGGSARRLTHLGDGVQGLSWVHEDRILYSSRRNGEFSLWSVSPGRGEPRWLGLAGLRAVKPRGSDRGLVFEHQKFDSDIWRLELGGDGEAERVIASTAWEDEPRFSPGGSEIVYVSRRSGRPELWLSDRDGKSAARVAHPRFRSIRSPRWSHDGRRIVFAADIRDAADIYLLDRSSGSVVRLTSGASNNVAPAWGPEGESIYFSSDRAGFWQMLAMNLADRSTRVLLEAPVGAIEVTADGRHLFFSRLDQPGIWRMPTSGRGTIDQFVAELEPSDLTNWELRGDQLYYLTRSTPQRLVGVHTNTEETTVTLPLPMSEDDYGLTIAPDTGTVLFTRGDRTESDLMWLESNR